MPHAPIAPDWGEDHGQARKSDPLTSHGAAASIKPGSARHSLLLAHSRRPSGLTDEEACDISGLSRASEYATRCSELRRMGLIEDTTQTRMGAAHMQRIVRRITPAGWTALGIKPPDTSITVHCTSCTEAGRTTEASLSSLTSKYGKPQLVGDIKGHRLYEAKCDICEPKPHRGTQSIWKEN